MRAMLMLSGQARIALNIQLPGLRRTHLGMFQADALVERCLQIIEQLEPKVWFLENPDSGYLKTRAVVADLPFVRLEYCMYGAPYRKRTRIWTNLTDWQPKMCDRSHLVDNKHIRTAQHGMAMIGLLWTTCTCYHRHCVTSYTPFL